MGTFAEVWFLFVFRIHLSAPWGTWRYGCFPSRLCYTVFHHKFPRSLLAAHRTVHPHAHISTTKANSNRFGRPR
ncbi:hypothetical protein EDB89DRAFT_2238937 [Lactarius sanguifluus]|nr:hypothetical protein EDB89DRAFT_2238937 [Lactarius sanguifluus]